MYIWLADVNMGGVIFNESFAASHLNFGSMFGLGSNLLQRNLGSGLQGTNTGTLNIDPWQFSFNHRMANGQATNGLGLHPRLGSAGTFHVRNMVGNATTCAPTAA